MVLVEPRKHHNFSKVNFFRRHSYSGSVSMINNGIEEIQPAVDFPVQFNFGSPYSSSLTVFFDFEESREIVADMSRTGKKLKTTIFSKKL